MGLRLPPPPYPAPSFHAPSNQRQKDGRNLFYLPRRPNKQLANQWLPLSPNVLLCGVIMYCKQFFCSLHQYHFVFLKSNTHQSLIFYNKYWEIAVTTLFFFY